jgi:tetratricopeptide (TPR) repeat protein
MSTFFRSLLLFVLLLLPFTSAFAQNDCAPGTDYVAKSQSLMDSQQLDGAISAATCAIEAEPRQSLPYVMRGVAYYMEGDYQNALADLTQANGLEPDNPGVNYYLGLVNFQIGEYEQSIANFDVTLQITSGTPTDTGILANAYTYRGLSNLGLDKFEDAITDLKKAAQIDPNSPLIYVARGSAYANLHQYQAAIGDFNRFMEMSPFAADQFIRVNGMNVAISDYPKLVADVSTANLTLQLNPKDAEAYRQRGDARFQLGEFDEALADFNQAIELNPSDGAAYALRARLHRVQQDNDHALADYTRAIDLDSKNADLYSARGWTYIDMGDYENGLADFDQTLELRTDEPGDHLDRGIAYSLSGDNVKAAEDYLQWANGIQTDEVDGGDLTSGEPAAADMAEGRVIRYEFDAQGGDHLRLSAISAISYLDVDTLIIVLGPDGSPLYGKDDVVANQDSRAIIDDFEVPEDGTYTLIVTHAGGVKEGAINVLVEPSTPGDDSSDA